MNSLGMVILLLVSGLILSLNPFNISIFTWLLAGALDKAHSRRKIRLIAIIYLWLYWLLIAAFGIVLILLLGLLTDTGLQILALVVSGLMIVLGVINLGQYFWNRPHKQLPRIIQKFLHMHAVKKNSPTSALVLATLAGWISLTSVGPHLIALAVIVRLLAPTEPLWMLLPATALILPLKLIYLQVLKGYKTSTILRWKDESKLTMRLGFALVHIALGWLILLILNGSIV
jgi:hypothetical protein